MNTAAVCSGGVVRGEAEAVYRVADAGGAAGAGLAGLP